MPTDQALQNDVTFTKYTSGFKVNNTNIGIEAAKVQWPAISALTATSAATTTSGIMTPDQIQALVSNKVASVYKVKGTLIAEVTEGAITNMPTNAVEGDVYNIKLPDGTTSATIGTETVFNGDNVVYVVTKVGETETTSWDKLAASVSLDGYATETWVSSNYSGTSAKVAGAITTSAGIADTASAGELVQAGAVSGYVETKISETIAETIDIVSEIKDNTETSAIPNVGAIKTYDSKNVTSAFGTVIVNGLTGTETTVADHTYTASAKNDKIKFVGGTNVSLAATTDANGNPTITINNTYEAADVPTATGGNGVTAAYVAASEGVAAHYEVSGIDATPSTATNATKGVTYAAYYDEETGLINLF